MSKSVGVQGVETSRLSYLLPLTSGIALVFAYAPFSIPVLPFVGLVPLFWFFRRPVSARDVVVGGLAFALPYFVGNTYWMFYLSRFTAAGSIGALGSFLLHSSTFFFFPVALNVARHNLRVPLPLAAPFLWTVSENARTYGDFPFPYVTLGYTLSDWPFLIQHADLVGVYGISLWLALVNAVVVVLIAPGERSPRSRPAWGLVLIALLVVPCGYSALRWRSVERALLDAPTLEVAVVQPNIAQRLKWSREAWEDNLERLNRVISEAERSRPALVVGPEASLPMVVHVETERLPDGVDSGDVPLVLGMVRGLGENLAAGENRVRYLEHVNSAVLVRPDRTILAAHDKQLLVPVTEQIPYKEVFGFLLPFMRKQFGRFVPGEQLRLLTLDTHDPPLHFGALICYESLFPSLVSRMSRMGAAFFVNITNDAWFGRSSMPHQHAGFPVLRAIENRRSVVRSANTGVSALVDPLGRMTARTGLFERAILRGEVALLDSTTAYARLGDVLLYLSYAASALLLGLSWRAHRAP